ncbi:hypothetical protein Airi01_088640 [Actinoallomurus iriomotensis]|uniref:Uncharacterized protein n=1 Tax=Actinoallomurus iriomotensis TaxID=478107 RepID=A0A9W6RUZ3_9ACTN|nr:hypothetical protein Airi01_088640 [Actinoallomurus iriomotensis]
MGHVAIVQAGYSDQRLMTGPDFASDRRQAPRATSMNSPSEPVGDAATTNIGMAAPQVLTCGFPDIPTRAKLRIKSPQALCHVGTAAVNLCRFIRHCLDSSVA